MAKDSLSTSLSHRGCQPPLGSQYVNQIKFPYLLKCINLYEKIKHTTQGLIKN